MVKEELVKLFAKRIAMMEGFYVMNGKRNPAQRNNNPGNLRSWGSMPIVDGFAKFPTIEEGWRALYVQVTKNIFVRKLTFREFFCGNKSYGGYAPDADGNHCKHYAEFVAEFFGAKIDQKINELVK